MGEAKELLLCTLFRSARMKLCPASHFMMQNPIIHPEARSLLDLLRRIEDALESSQDRLERPWDTGAPDPGNKKASRTNSASERGTPKRMRKPLEAYRPDEQAIIRWL